MTLHRVISDAQAHAQRAGLSDDQANDHIAEAITAYIQDRAEIEANRPEDAAAGHRMTTESTALAAALDRLAHDYIGHPRICGCMWCGRPRSSDIHQSSATVLAALAEQRRRR